jgi:hypothetical protein
MLNGKLQLDLYWYDNAKKVLLLSKEVTVIGLITTIRLISDQDGKVWLFDFLHRLMF